MAPVAKVAALEFQEKGLQAKKVGVLVEFLKRGARFVWSPLMTPLPGRHPFWNQSKWWCYRHFLGVNGRKNAFPHRARSQP
jgi:hypothetical protein